MCQHLRLWRVNSGIRGHCKHVSNVHVVSYNRRKHARRRSMAVGCVMTLYYRPPINATMSSAATTAPTMMKMRSSLLPSDDLPPPPALAPVSLCSRYMTSCYYTITTCHQHTCKKQSFQNVLPTHTNRVLKVCLCDRYYTVCPLALIRHDMYSIYEYFMIYISR